MQPNTAKMILFTDASDKVELDEYPLPSEHYFRMSTMSMFWIIDQISSGWLHDIGKNKRH